MTIVSIFTTYPQTKFDTLLQFEEKLSGAINHSGDSGDVPIIKPPYLWLERLYGLPFAINDRTTKQKQKISFKTHTKTKISSSLKGITTCRRSRQNVSGIITYCKQMRHITCYAQAIFTR
jgi:hypothetical protein